MFNRIFHFILYSQLDFILITVALNYEGSLTTHLKGFQRLLSPDADLEKIHNCLSFKEN